MKIYQDIYDILDALRKRPALYLGSNKSKKSFISLIAFLSGLQIAQFKLKQIDEGEPSFRYFSSWITARVEGMSKTMAWEWMIEEWGNETAFEKFFELLDEYRSCKSVCLSRAIIRNHHQPTFVQIINGQQVEPEKPLKICIAQFFPSEVYSLLEIYTNKQDEDFPYQNSIEEVKEVALSKWGVAKNEWFDF